MNYLLGLMGAVCYAPLGILFPAIFWMYDFNSWRKGSLLKQMAWGFHVVVALIGIFSCVSGTYATIKLIIEAYSNGEIGSFYIVQ